MRRALLFADATISKGLRPFLRTIPHTNRISPSFFRQLSSKINGLYGDTRCVFISSSQLGAFLDKLRDDFSGVVMLGDSDHDLTEEEYVLLNSFSRTVFFVQNMNFKESPRVKLLPIGIEDLSWAKNGLPWNFCRNFSAKSRKSMGILVGPFGSTHFDRGEVLRALDSNANPEVHVFRSRVASWQYSNLSSRYKYVVCPRGNGLDTHRFWETLYRGSTPVVLKNEWSETLMSYKVPLVALNVWNELQELKSLSFSEANTQTIDYIRTSWWESRLHETLRAISRM